MAIDIFDFLGDVWDLLPETDRVRFGELWKSYEQTYADVWTKLHQSNLASSIDFVPLYSNQRWVRHAFDDATRVSRPATYRGNQDLSKPLNLTQKYLLNISVDGQPAVQVDLRGAAPALTSSFEIVTKLNSAFGASFASLEEGGSLLRLRSRTSGISSNITVLPALDPQADATAIILGIDESTIPTTFPKYRYAYQLSDRAIVGIPHLQDKVRDDLVETKLTEGIDYLVEFGSGVISFREPPPREYFWGKDNFVNQETPYNNFGYLLDIYDSNTDSYLKAVKGLWFAFWTGPRPENIRRSIYLLFGLPTASQDGTVSSVVPGTTSASGAYTPGVISLTYSDSTTEFFQIPQGLLPEVSVGEPVTRFQPLVTGIKVYDKLNSPGFLEREVGRSAVSQFLTEGAIKGIGADTDETLALKLIEQNTYLPQIDVNAFIRPDIKLSNVKNFLRNIQPKSRTFLFQVLVGSFKDKLSLVERVSHEIGFSINPNLDYNPSLEVQYSDLVDAEESAASGLSLDSETLSAGDDIWVWRSFPENPTRAELVYPDLPQGGAILGLSCAIDYTLVLVEVTADPRISSQLFVPDTSTELFAFAGNDNDGSAGLGSVTSTYPGGKFVE